MVTRMVTGKTTYIVCALCLNHIRLEPTNLKKGCKVCNTKFYAEVAATDVATFLMAELVVAAPTLLDDTIVDLGLAKKDWKYFDFTS